MSQSRKGHPLKGEEGRESICQNTSRSKDIMRKVEKIRRKQLFQQQIFPVRGMSSVYEAKNRLLKNNNKSLARALSDQKMETNHWYTEVISLKGELQEAQEKLLKIPDNSMHSDSAFVEAGRQIKESCESIDKDFDSALERILEAVEKLTKAKQLVMSTMNLLQCPSRNSLNTFSRTPGSRIPLEASGVNPSPRQRAVLPMVGGHVLQPVMVPLPKLKIEWNNRRNNHVLVSEGHDLDMSTIGEQSLTENSEVSEEQPSEDNEDQLQSDEEIIRNDEARSQSEHESVNLEVKLEEDTSRRSSLRRKSKSSSELQNSRPEGMRVRGRRQGLIRGGLKSRTEQGQDSSTLKSSPAKASKALEERAEVHMSTQENDALEGPSWLLDIGESRTFRSRFRSRRLRLNNQKDVEMANAAAVSESSDGTDSGIDISQKFRQAAVQQPGVQIKDSSTTISTKDSSPQLPDLSCLDSPTSMLTRLEVLEAKGGRKSRRFLERRMHIGNLESSQLPAEASATILHDKKHIDGDTVLSTEKILHEFSREKDQEIDFITANKVEPCNTSSALLNERIGHTDHDLTCQTVTNMDITQPVSDIIIQQSSTTSTDLIQDRIIFTQSKKKFFKTKEHEIIDDIPKVVEKTPFDLSVLNESVVNLPPFSATRTTEKENLPPLSAENGEYVSLCDVSVVLEDVLKEPVCSNTPKRSIRIKQKGSQSANCISSNIPRKQRCVTRRTLQYPVNYDEGSDETWEPKRSRQTSKRRTKDQLSDSAHMSVKCNSISELKSLKRSAEKSLDDLGDTDNVEEVEGRKRHDSSDKTEREILSNCYVMVHRTNIVETPVNSIDTERCPRKDLQDNLGLLPDLQQQLSEDQKLEEATPDANEDNPENCNSSPVSADRGTNNIDKEEEDGKHIHIEKMTSKPESKESIEDGILLHVEEPYDKESQPSEGKHQQLAGNKHSVTVNPFEADYYGFEGFDSSTVSRTSRMVNELTSATKNLIDVDYHEVIEKTNTESPRVKTCKSKSKGIFKHNDSTRKLSDSTSNVEEHLPVDYPRQRRAATKISSYKEVSLRQKLRRGKETVHTSPSEVKGKRRRKVVKDEVSS